MPDWIDLKKKKKKIIILTSPPPEKNKNKIKIIIINHPTKIILNRNMIITQHYHRESGHTEKMYYSEF